MTIEEARAILNMGYDHLFRVEDVAEAVGLAPTSIRNWINRGHVELIHSALFGKGSRAYFAYYDVILILIVAELSHLGIKPQSVRHVLVQINALVGNKIREAAGEWGDPEQHPNYRDFQRYAVLYFSREGGQDGIEIYSPADPREISKPTPESPDVTRIVIDCLALAEKAMHLFSILPRAK